MDICLDTSAIIKLKKMPELIEKLNGENLFTTTITQYELLIGSFFYGKEERKFVEKVLSILKIISVEKSIKLAAKISASLMKIGEKVNDFDI